MIGKGIDLWLFFGFGMVARDFYGDIWWLWLTYLVILFLLVIWGGIRLRKDYEKKRRGGE